MNCPKCSSVMEQVKYQEIEVDRCTNCKGIWFDLLEHIDLKKIKGSEKIDIGDPTEGKEYNKIEDINCPKCNIKMIKMVDREQTHIWYERCIKCYGLFFDAGEFTDYKHQTIIDRIKDLRVIWVSCG